MFVRCVYEIVENPDYTEPPWGDIYKEDWPKAELREVNGNPVLLLNPGVLWEMEFPFEKLDSLEIVRCRDFSFENKLYFRSALLTTDLSDEGFNKCKQVLLVNQLRMIDNRLSKLKAAKNKIAGML